MHKFSFSSMGTGWEITVWDDLSPSALDALRTEVIGFCEQFDRMYSRFKSDSLVWKLSKQTGVVPVPRDLIEMLRLYQTFNALSGGACNPLIGYAISDLGYDSDYSLREKETIRPVPELSSALRIPDDGHIELTQSVLIDLGALGKGYAVDRIAQMLRDKGLKRFLVNGSGDIVYEGDGEPIRCGMEHPDDPTKVIGVVELTCGAFCASASNRRRWGKHHHMIDPRTLASPEDLRSSWVTSDRAAVADGLATCLFLTEPEQFNGTFSFEYCMLNAQMRVRTSPGFSAELFT